MIKFKKKIDWKKTTKQMAILMNSVVLEGVY
jgi:hypothetical protein